MEVKSDAVKNNIAEELEIYSGKLELFKKEMVKSEHQHFRNQ